MVDWPIIGILVSNSNKRKKILKLYQCHHNLPLKLFAFSRSGILWKKHKIIGLCQNGVKWEERIFPFPHAIYNQCYNRKATTIERLNNVIGGDKCFNSINWFNKWRVYNLLIETNLQMYIPDTFLLKEVDISELVKKYKLVYVKPSYGHHGKSVYRLELKENGDIHMSLHSLAPRFICRKNEDIQQKLAELLGENIFLVQKGIQTSQINNQNFDIRVLVQKDISGKWAVSTMACRVANELYFNTGVYESIFDAEEIFDVIFLQKKMKETTINSIKKISVNAAQVLETNIGLLGELSVDFVLDEEMNLWIIEINGNPQKSIYRDIDNFKYKQLIYRSPIEYAYYLSKH